MAEHQSGARKRTGVSRQNPSGTAAFTPHQKSGCTAAIETCRPRHAKKSLAKGGGVHVRPFGIEEADLRLSSGKVVAPRSKPLTAPEATKAEGLELIGTRPYVQQFLCRVRMRTAMPSRAVGSRSRLCGIPQQAVVAAQGSIVFQCECGPAAPHFRTLVPVRACVSRFA